MWFKNPCNIHNTLSASPQTIFRSDDRSKLLNCYIFLVRSIWISFQLPAYKIKIALFLILSLLRWRGSLIFDSIYPFSTRQNGASLFGYTRFVIWIVCKFSDVSQRVFRKTPVHFKFKLFVDVDRWKDTTDDVKEIYSVITPPKTGIVES